MSNLRIVNAGKVYGTLPDIRPLYDIVLVTHIGGVYEGDFDQGGPYYLFERIGVNVVGAKIIWNGPSGGLDKSLIVGGKEFHNSPTRTFTYNGGNDYSLGVNIDVAIHSLFGSNEVTNYDSFTYVHPDGRTIDFAIRGMLVRK